MRSPRPRASATGSSLSSSSVMVGALRLRSNTPASRIATGLGPGTAPGTHARPTSVPAVPSAGRLAAGVSCSCMSPPFQRPAPVVDHWSRGAIRSTPGNQLR